MLQKTKPLWSKLGLLTAAAVLTLSGATAQPAATAQGIMVLDGGTLIDGTGKAPITDAVVVVRGNRITAVGKRGQVQIPAGANVIKTDGRTILPGLIDSHSHTQDYFIPMFLHYGVTTIQDKYNDPAWLMAEREALRNGTIQGPRFYISGQNLNGPQANGSDAANSHPATTAEEARAHAQSLVANGVDNLNVTQSLSDAELRAIEEVGKAAGIPVMGHVKNSRKAAEAGYMHQEHMWSLANAIMDPDAKMEDGLGLGFGPPGAPPEALVDKDKMGDLIKFLVAHNVFINPTLVCQWTAVAYKNRGDEFIKAEQALAKDPQLGFVPAEVKMLWNKAPEPPRLGYDFVAKFLHDYVAAGGKVIVGTDTSHHVIAGLSVHYEMQMLVDDGLTPMQAIEGATLWNAQLMKKEKDLGSVEVGKLADFAIIEGDPLKDIANTRNIRMVIKDGQVMDTKYDPKWVNPIANAGTANYGPPEIAKVSPVARQGGPTVTLEIDGTGDVEKSQAFKPDSIVRFDNVDLPTKFVSGKQLTATLDAKLLQRGPGMYPVYVVNPGLHGAVSPAAYEVIDTAAAPVTGNPVPYRQWVSDEPKLYGPIPRMANQGSASVTLQVEVAKAFPNSVVRFDNVDLPTKFVSGTKLTATVDAKLLQRPVGSYAVYVVNPGPFGNISQEGHFMVLPKDSKVKWNYVAD